MNLPYNVGLLLSSQVHLSHDLLYYGHIKTVNCHVVSFSAEEVGFFLEPLGLETKAYVFLAVNDNADHETAGGNHWLVKVYLTSHLDVKHYSDVMWL